MFKCPRCGGYIQNMIDFCPYCGTHFRYHSHQKPNIAKRIVGMALSTYAFASSIFYLFYTLMLTATTGGDGFVTGIILAMVTLPPAIIGLVFSTGCINQGDSSALCKLGKVFGIISIVLNGVMLFLSFIIMVAVESVSNSYYY